MKTNVISTEKTKQSEEITSKLKILSEVNKEITGNKINPQEINKLEKELRELRKSLLNAESRSVYKNSLILEKNQTKLSGLTKNKENLQFSLENEKRINDLLVKVNKCLEYQSTLITNKLYQTRNYIYIKRLKNILDYKIPAEEVKDRNNDREKLYLLSTEINEKIQFYKVLLDRSNKNKLSIENELNTLNSSLMEINSEIEKIKRQYGSKIDQYRKLQLKIFRIESIVGIFYDKNYFSDTLSKLETIEIEYSEVKDTNEENDEIISGIFPFIDFADKITAIYKDLEEQSINYVKFLSNCRIELNKLLNTDPATSLLTKFGFKYTKEKIIKV
jgi:hypothetical protein